MFRQLKVPVLGMIENMSFFDVVAYLRDRGGPEAHRLIDAKSFFDTPGDERVYIFGRGGARRKAEAMGVPFLGEVPLNIFLRETGDEGKMEHALASRLPRPALPARCRRAARRSDQHPEHQDAQDAEAGGFRLDRSWPFQGRSIMEPTLCARSPPPQCTPGVAPVGSPFSRARVPLTSTCSTPSARVRPAA